MAPQDLVQTEAEVANREYDLDRQRERAGHGEFERSPTSSTLRRGPAWNRRRSRPSSRSGRIWRRAWETAFARRTDWLRAEIGLEFARIGLRAARNNRLPDLSLNA